MVHRYRGQRKDSFQAIDTNELVEIRARQRTFYGAYNRTALSNLGSALTVLRLFDRRFYYIGILFAVLGAALFIITFLRARDSRHDFADPWTDDLFVKQKTYDPNVIQTTGQEGTRIFGKPFLTAGWYVLAVAVIVAAIELALLVLILRL